MNSAQTDESSVVDNSYNSELPPETKRLVSDLVKRGNSCLRNSAMEVIEFGKVLIELKELLPHGKFTRCVDHNDAEAVEWYRKAAEQNYAPAQTNLGLMYDRGEGVSKDYVEAVKWYRKAAEQGDAKAQFDLGLMYSEGEGVPKDYAEAVKWYRKAAEQGNAMAQTNLGLMYSEGEGVPKDYAEAVKWFRKAAEQGAAMAQYNLGSMYYKGEGVTRDYTEAYMWALLAAAQGYERAQAPLDFLEHHMTPNQISEAKKQAAAWQPVSPNPVQVLYVHRLVV